MASSRVVPALDELEERHARLGLGGELAARQELALEGGEEALATLALSWASPTEPIEGRTPASLQRRPKATDVCCEPWSEWWMTSRGRRCPMAMLMASITSCALRPRPMAQPTIRREKASSTTAG